jgi:TolA-binding protein
MRGQKVMTRRSRPVFAGLMVAGLAIASVPVQAQQPRVDARVGKLEKEMRAVQRTVFPLGTPIEPESGMTTPAVAAGSPASAPITDLTARVDGLERQLATLTGQIEQMGFANRQQDDRLKALEAKIAKTETPGSVEAAPERPSATSQTPAQTPTQALAPSKPIAAKPPSAKTDPARKAALAAVEMPSTGDAAEDAYTYGFRLYSGRFYPEAQAKLKEFVVAFPKHKRASYAQNLLGRAYLDEGKPALASVAFYENYQKMPKGERAPDSLYWLGLSLMKLNKAGDACKAYAEFSEVYGATAPTELKARVAKGRADAKCAA